MQLQEKWNLILFWTWSVHWHNLIRVHVWFYSAESVTLNDCLQLSYLPSKRNYMLLLYPREILILDLEVNQTVGVIAIERTGVPFIQVSKIWLGFIVGTANNSVKSFLLFLQINWLPQSQIL